MATLTKIVEHEGIELDCEFEWEQYIPETQFQPAEGGFEHISKVFHNGEDIMDLLSEYVIEELERKIQQEYE